MNSNRVEVFGFIATVASLESSPHRTLVQVWNLDTPGTWLFKRRLSYLLLQRLTEVLFWAVPK